jgi:hypothetical protein
MSTFVVFTNNPDSDHSWERLTAVDAVTQQEVELKEMLADILRTPGTYLVEVKLDITVLQEPKVEAQQEASKKETDFSTVKIPVVAAEPYQDAYGMPFHQF